jgi:acetyltransferase-like isoleucine patch superfamily enzyme
MAEAPALTSENAWARISPSAAVELSAVVGELWNGSVEPTIVEDECLIRGLTVIYTDCRIGAGTVTGIRVLIREHTSVGARCVIGSNTIIEGQTSIGDETVLQSGVYVPTHCEIGERTFFGPHAVLTNDRYPLRRRDSYHPEGPVIEDDATIGANATLLPGVRIGRGAMVAAGAVVTSDVPAWTLAVGVPARIQDLPPELHEPNQRRKRA